MLADHESVVNSIQLLSRESILLEELKPSELTSVIRVNSALIDHSVARALPIDINSSNIMFTSCSFSLVILNLQKTAGDPDVGGARTEGSAQGVACNPAV
mmetsp:Transcript_28789/g.70215  ORF Transcript_28789/g.70215 Transcript_28789/m.70215 type:complete len:100 (-) Transcript_28789:54-353(-)